jgi:protease-4
LKRRGVSMKKRIGLATLILGAAAFLAAGCGGLHVNIGAESKKKPLKEFTLQGSERGKILVIPIRGFLSDVPEKSLLGDKASIVEEVVSQLRMAEDDGNIKAILLKINSYGGSTTASDILYHEIMGFKERTKIKVVAALMDVAASGGYYVALPADRIIAHPTTITGSVGVVMILPKFGGLMDKLGLSVEVSKSGKEKDMGSPFRPSTPEEQKILQDLTDKMGKRFMDLVAKHRSMDGEKLTVIGSARIYLADEALQMKLVDRIGYMDSAISEAIDLAGLSKDAKVVVYRRAKYPNDTIYNTSVSSNIGGGRSLVDLNLPEIVPNLQPGFYYLWTPGMGGN